ncbi:hypothetical protein FQN49_000999 [Arthroderma sp. PD_2]|nr:hypothetical protein FQN49_000999 [Arthroderma sp. PD_2]
MDQNTTTINNLSPGHLDAFIQTVNRIISTDHARDTFAQIVNGKPAFDTDYDSKTGRSLPHPIRLSGPSEEDIEVAKLFQERFKADVLEVKSSLVQAYQNTALGSREFKIRLLEMAAVAFHNIAAVFFSSCEHDTQPKPDYDRPVTQPEFLKALGLPPPPPPPKWPTRLRHEEYAEYERNPLGIAGMVGYWAELKLFGGIVLFDRGESEQEALDPYIHPRYPYMIYKLSDVQLDSFVDFATSKDRSDPRPPLPIPFVTEKYACRVDPEHAIEKHIFREKNERRPLWMRYTDRSVHRRYVREDYPDFLDFLERKKKEEEEGRGGIVYLPYHH